MITLTEFMKNVKKYVDKDPKFGGDADIRLSEYRFGGSFTKRQIKDKIVSTWIHRKSDEPEVCKIQRNDFRKTDPNEIEDDAYIKLLDYFLGVPSNAITIEPYSIRIRNVDRYFDRYMEDFGILSIKPTTKTIYLSYDRICQPDIMEGKDDYDPFDDPDYEKWIDDKGAL